MVDERDLKCLIRVIQSVATVVHIYVVERGNDGIERRSGEGSGTKRSSGRGSNDPSGTNIPPVFPINRTVPGFSTILENTIHQSPIHHHAEPKNFNYGGSDDVVICNEPIGDIKEKQKIPFLNDMQLTPFGDSGKDWSSVLVLCPNQTVITDLIFPKPLGNATLFQPKPN
ncbi:hypothetical protein LXL04_039200 [Taraxacum kok-saghyz]